jgi:hypothetical protein
VRSIVLSGARSWLVVFLTFSLLNVPVFAASEKPLGMVVTADHAQLDNAKAAVGADVFSGDAVATEPDGSLRMKVGASEVYLLASSSVTFAPREDKVQAKIDRGTVGFSTPASSQFEVETPLGVVSGANGQHVFGQVSVVTPTSMLVTAYEGALVVRSANGQEKMVDEGQTYEATLLPDGAGGGGQAPAGAGSGGGGGQTPVGVGGTGIKWDNVAKVAIPAVILGVTSLVIWLEESESCVTTNCN